LSDRDSTNALSNDAFAVGRFPAVDDVAAGAHRHAKITNGADPRIDYGRVIIDPAIGRSIAKAYMRAPLLDESALGAYAAFRRETIVQFELLTSPSSKGGLGIDVQVTPYDPYLNATTLAADIRQGGRLKVYSSRASGNPHPLLTDDENDMFRAVHDAFGHAATGRGFDQHGEEAAWLRHCFMYSRAARNAVTTETRGQSNALFFHYGGKRFPDQKAVLLPSCFSDVTKINLLR